MSIGSVIITNKRQFKFIKAINISNIVWIMGRCEVVAFTYLTVAFHAYFMLGNPQKG